jgi:hypothetical protein
MVFRAGSSKHWRRCPSIRGHLPAEEGFWMSLRTPIFLIAFSEVETHFTSILRLLFRVTPFALSRCSESITSFLESAYVNNTTEA